MSEEYREEALKISKYYFEIYGKSPDVLAGLISDESKQNIKQAFWDGYNSIIEATSAVTKLVDLNLNVLDYYDRASLEDLVLDLRAWHVNKTDSLALKIEQAFSS